MYPLIIAALLLILLGSWLLSVRHKLSVLDENAGSAMSQIGVQLASRFDALNMLLRLPELYALPVVPAILEEIQAKQAPITAESTPAAGLNRVLDRFPVSLAARLLGFHPRGCLPTPDTPLTGHTI